MEQTMSYHRLTPLLLSPAERVKSVDIYRQSWVALPLARAVAVLGYCSKRNSNRCCAFNHCGVKFFTLSWGRGPG